MSTLGALKTLTMYAMNARYNTDGDAPPHRATT
jgi:hypothetical protein